MIKISLHKDIPVYNSKKRNSPKRKAARRLLFSKTICDYEDLGAEAIRRLEIEDLPVTVIIDAEGNNLYETGRKAYLDTL